MIPSLTLHDGVEVPQLGFGVFQVPPDGHPARSSRRRLPPATATSTRPLPTATRRESARRSPRPESPATRSSSPPSSGTRSRATTRPWRRSRRASGGSGMERVDLYLIHWPVPAQGLYVETWKAFERIHGEGRSRTIGVSNFRVEDLERLGRETETRADRQPGRATSRASSRPSCAPGTPSTGSRPRPGAPSARAHLLDEEAIVEIAERHGRPRRRRSCAGTCSSATSSSPSRSPRSGSGRTSSVFDFELSAEEMAEFAAIDTGRRFGPDPAEFISP